MTISDERNAHRRRFLAAGASALTAGLAGCSGVLSGDTDDSSEDGESGEGAPDESESDGDSADEETIDVPVDGEAERIEYGRTATGTLDGDAPASDSYGGRYDPWAFRADEGDVVTIGVSSDADSMLFLLDADGELVARNDDATGEDGDARIAGVALPSGGPYAVLVAGYGSPDPFEYDLTVEEGVDEPVADLREIQVGEQKRGEVDAADPFDEESWLHYEPVAFEGEAGESVTIEMTAGDALPDPVLRGPDGGVVAKPAGGADVGSGRIEDRELPETGEYTIEARALLAYGRREYELSVESA